MTASLRVRSHAKINLYLDVFDRREDGFHHLETIFQSVDLADELTAQARANGIELTCTPNPVASVEDNLAYRAARLLQERYGVDRGARLTIAKHVPIAAGLAGGSGDAAAALAALNALWDLQLDDETLASLALELGSDVPYCLLGGTVAATGRGEILSPLPALRDGCFLLVHPPIQVSTAWLFNHPDLPRKQRPETPWSLRFQAAVAAVREGRIADAMFNAFEDVVFAAHPHLRALKQNLLDAGCDAAVMSGSGPTLVGLCATRPQAQAAQERLGDVVTTVTQPVSEGVRIVGADEGDV